ncbi:MAG: cofactor-independent phosphoglycerate mutase [archaeon]
MKYIIFLGDGMADDTKTCKQGNTPLMIAKKPNIDALMKKGIIGSLTTIPKIMPAGSEIANMSILGYDPAVYYQGRGVLEAASMGIDIKEGEVAIRCNLICIEDNKIKNHSAGHITSQESEQLISYLDEKLGDSNIRFYPGISYRHLLVIKNASNAIDLTPPHDVPGTEVGLVMPRPLHEKGEATAKQIDSLIRKSWELLSTHQINIKRIKEGKDPANSIWPWSPGYRPHMISFHEKYGIRAAVISAVDLIKGLGVYAGMDIIKVDGATGLYDTNYEGKADACIAALKDHDLVYVHVEAPDEAGHEGNFALKVKTIEDFDKRLIGRVLNNLKTIDGSVKIAVLPDHPTPIKLRTHTRDPVPFIIADPDDPQKDTMLAYDERITDNANTSHLKGDDFIKLFLKVDS